MSAPDAGLTADARIAAVVGAAGPGTQRTLLTGPAGEVAARIAAFLVERGYVR